MPNAYAAGIASQYDQSPQVRNDMSAVAINWFANRCPLVTRTPRSPVGSVTFTIHSRSYRKRTALTAAAINNNSSQTTITLDDASQFMAGDVLELHTGERVEVVSVASNNVVTIKRGVDSTTAIANTNNNSTVTLITNARTGSEVDQDGISRIPVGVAQYCQTFQHPVQVGGSLQSSTSFVLEPGARTPLDQFKMDSLQNLMDDMEYAAYYGKGEAPASGNRPKMKGIKALIDSGNVTTSPSDASGYKAVHLIRDLVEKARSGGGEPDVLMVSTNFMTGFATWGHAVQRIDAGTSIFGQPFKVFEAVFLPGLSIIEAPLLKAYTACALTSSEVAMRFKRNEYWNPRGVRGDAFEADWMAECAVELGNPTHHAWVEGITGFAA